MVHSVYRTMVAMERLCLSLCFRLPVVMSLWNISIYHQVLLVP